MGYRDGLKLKYAKLDALAALQAPVSALLGISADAEETLKQIGINTVFDLATSPVFTTASETLGAAEGYGDSVIARVGRIPHSFIDPEGPVTPEAIVETDLVMLREIGQELATDFKKNLQTETVGDLGRLPAFRAAKEILDAAVPTAQAREEASELVPKLGEYPTEKHYYSTVVIDHVTPGQTTDLAGAGPIDISPAAAADFGFKAPAVGAILTFVQSWYTQGLTLGNLLHSVALAPGESTRIAMMDWSRRTFASGTENITEAERLSNTSSHSRAISEVQSAVANEVQTGFSQTKANSTTSAGGGGFGLSLGPLTIGGSGSEGSTSSSAASFSSSMGSRSLAASMSQRINDVTQQAASSVRERRASIVKEVSEEEHQSVSTRILANYNHMHALTVQYFEVIEIYRVNVSLQQAERCLFIPMKFVSFTDDVIQRYRGALAGAALNRRALELLTSELGVVNIQPVLPMKRFGTIFDHVADVDKITLRTATIEAAISATSAADGSIRDGILERNPSLPPLTPTGGAGSGTVGTPPPASPATPASPPAAPPSSPAPGAGTNTPGILTAPAPAWLNEEIFRASRITRINVIKPGKNTLQLPGEVELMGVSFDVLSPNNSPFALTSVQIKLLTGSIIALTSASPVDWNTSQPIPLQEIDQIRVTSASESRFLGKAILQLGYSGSRFPISINVEIVPRATEQPICRIIPQESGAELKLHLENNRLHYNQAIWRSLDPSTIALLLSGFTFEGMPVADIVDPNPFMAAGNYLVFRMPGFVRSAGVGRVENPDSNSPEAIAARNWEKWLNDRGLVLGTEVSSEQLIPVPTGGVFAEAVLGRSNCAEKLDATRFWNWQDSPIPLQPPEIAAVQLDSRAQPIDVTPGHLGAPVVNIQNPTPLPDPTGVGAIIGAVQNGNMFRDMSGLAATIGLAQTLSGNATTAGTEAGRQAAANLAVAAQKDIEEKRIAAQLALAAMGVPSGNAGSPKNISESGALLNTASAMDKQSPKAGGAGGGPLGGVNGGPGGQGGTPSGEGGGGSGSGVEGGFDTSTMPGVPDSLVPFISGGRADDLMSKLTWGNLGTSGSNIVNAAYSGGKTSGGGLPGQQGVILFELACVANFPKPWPDDPTEIQAIINDNWQPSYDDMDAMSPAATAAAGGTKPYSQVMTSIDDIVTTVSFFAPKITGFKGTAPSRVQRLNLFFYAGAQNLEFMGTLNTNGTRVSIFGPSLDIDAHVVDVTVLQNILGNPANTAALNKLKAAWTPDAEVFLYTAGGVPDDALAQAFAKVMGTKVRAFTQPFWVLPRYNSTQQLITDRTEFGIGEDFTKAAAARTKVLHKLDTLATRSFNP